MKLAKHVLTESLIRKGELPWHAQVDNGYQGDGF